jgi:hypothetical protein
MDWSRWVERSGVQPPRILERQNRLISAQSPRKNLTYLQHVLPFKDSSGFREGMVLGNKKEEVAETRKEESDSICLFAL